MIDAQDWNGTDAELLQRGKDRVDGDIRRSVRLGNVISRSDSEAPIVGHGTIPSPPLDAVDVLVWDADAARRETY